MTRTRSGALAGVFLLAAGCAGPGLRAPAPPPAGATVWDFSDPAAPLSASTGTAVMSAWDPRASGWWGEGRDRFGPASGFGLPLIDGQDFRVLRLPALRPTEGLSVRHRGRPNGMFRREGFVSNYTLLFDLLLPSGRRGSYAGLLQTDPSNRSDADICAGPRDPPGIGIAGSYFGALDLGAWHRVALAVQAATGAGGTGQIQMFIDGAFVGGLRTPHEGPLNRWALSPEFLLFTDNDGETSELFLKSVLFEDRMMSMEEIAALGGPSLRGALIPGPAPKPIRRLAARRLAVIGHRGGYACCAPENSLESLELGFQRGDDHAEVDVRLSAEGTAVLMHDAEVGRTTDGTGNIAEMTLPAIKRLDAGRALSDRFAGTRIATLADALRVVGGRGRLLLDIKSADAGPAIARALQEAGADASAVWFFRNTEVSPKADYRRWVPGAERLWGDPPATLDGAGFETLRALGVTGFDVDIASVTREFVDAAHARGMPVYSFTFLDPPAMLRAVELGLDGIETDYPSVLDALLPERRLPALPGGGYPKLAARGCPAVGLFRDGHFRELSGPPGSGFNRLLRGGAPTAEGLDCLKTLGVTDVVDLRDEGEGPDEAAAAAERGLAYHRFPMGASGPAARKDACAGLKPSSVERNRSSADAALEFIRGRLKSPVPGKIFIHCTHGQDRTGLLLGVYRMQADRYSKEEAAAEMRGYRYTPYCVLEEVWKGY